MRGKLSDTSVPEICRRLSDDGVTGALEVTGATGVARVFLRDGSVYWAMSPAPRAQLGARLVNAGFVSQEQLDRTLDEQQSAPGDRPKLGALLVEKGLVGRDVIRVFVQEQILDALFDLVRWEAGEWVFHPGDAVDERLPIDVPVRQLLVEVSRRQSEWDQIERTLITLDEVPDHVVGGNATTAALEQDEFTMLASIDGVRSVRELANDLGYSEFEAARIVYGLTLLGIVEIEGPAEEDDEPDLHEPDRDVLAAEPAASEAVAEEPAESVSSAVDDVLDLGHEPVTTPAPPTEHTPDDDLDVGAALEAALFGDDEPEPGAEREPAATEDAAGAAQDADDDSGLQVTVHFSLDDGAGDRSAHARAGAPETPAPDDAAPAAGGDTRPAAPDAPAATVEPAPADVEEPPAAGAWGDEPEGPEPWVFSADDFAAELGEEPQPVADAPDFSDEHVTSAPRWASPETDPEDWASPAADPTAAIGEAAFDLPGEQYEPAPEPETRPAAAEDDAAAPAAGRAEPAAGDASAPELGDDLDALVAELDAGDDEEPTAPRERPGAPPPPAPDERPDDAASPAASDLDDYAPQRAPTPEPAGDRGARGDVSEFLRELTRLNVEDEPADDEAPPPRTEPAERPQRRSTPPKDDDKGDKKKKGLFGWGR